MLMTKGEAGMKALKIEDHQGHFLTEEEGYETVDKMVVFKNLCQFLKLMHKHIRSDTWHNYLISIKR